MTNVLKLLRKLKHTFYGQKRFSKSCRLWDNVEKYGGAREAADDSVAHARCMLDE
jgi:hypothetical protein